MPKVWQGRIWTCDICGTTDSWSEYWQWYGSHKELEDKGVEAVTVTCSDGCREKAGHPLELTEDVLHVKQKRRRK